MSDEKVEERCEICGRIVYSNMYEGGYGGRGYYSYKNILVHEERRINLPERDNDALTVLVCQDCIDKEPSLHSLILKKRKEWFDEQIASRKRYIKSDQKEIKHLRDVQIPEQRNSIIELRKKRKELK